MNFTRALHELIESEELSCQWILRGTRLERYGGRSR